MDELEAAIEKSKKALLAGPVKLAADEKHFKMLVSEGLPRLMERLQRHPMSVATARRTARFFAVVQDFIYTCFRSPLLGEGPLRMDLSPLLYVLRLIVSADPVPPRHPDAGGSAATAAATAAGSACHFNRDHGRPLVRAFDGYVKHFWPDDEAPLR